MNNQIDIVGKQVFGSNWNEVKQMSNNQTELENFVQNQYHQETNQRGLEIGVPMKYSIKEKESAVPELQVQPGITPEDENNKITEAKNGGILDILTKPVFTIGTIGVPMWLLLVGGYVLLRRR